MKIQDVYDELKAVTDKDIYVTVSYEMNRYSSGNEEIECNIYIENQGHFSAPTFQLVLNQAMAAMGLIKPDILNIEQKPLTSNQILDLNEKHGYFQFADAQGDVTKAFVKDVEKLHGIL